LLSLFFIFLIALRLLLPFASHYKPELAQNLGETIGQPVSIKGMKAYWEGWTPWITLHDVTARDSKTTIKKIKARLSLAETLLQRKAVIKNIEVDGGELVIQQLPDKSYTINQMKIPVLTGAGLTGGTTPSVLVNFKNIDIYFVSEKFAVELHHVNMMMDAKNYEMRADNVEITSKDWLTKPIIVNGQITMKGQLSDTLSGNILLHDINIQDKDKLILKNLNGEILFSYPNVKSKLITATLLEEPVNIQFENDEIEVNGELNIAELIKIPELKFLEKIAEGRTDFAIKGNLQKNNYTFDSSLEGVNILLPEPLKKIASEKKPLHISANIENTRMLINATYHQKMAVSILAENQKNNWDITTADISFGSPVTQSFNKQGIYVHGNIPEFNVLEWKDYFSGNGPSEKPFEMNVNFGKLLIAGIPLYRTHIQAKTLKDNWLLKINGETATADIWIPKNLKTNKLKMVVKKIYLTSKTLKDLTESTATKFTIGSNQVPTLDLYFQKFYYDNDDVGAIHVLARRGKNGLLIQKITLKSPNVNFIMKGSWIGNKSVLCGCIKTTNFGDFLRDWEITKSLDGSDGTVAFNLQWLGPIYAVNLPKLNGNLTVSLSDGVILDIVDNKMEMVGKILNIVSVDSLEFLLSKPFGDIAPKKKGFDFEVEKADFTIQNGILKTKDFYLYGSLAEVNANGSIGLVARDYNLYVSITPFLTAFLPMNLSLAGGPVIYGFVWLADKLMSGILNGFFRQDYHVTGSWSHPIYHKIKDSN